MHLELILGTYACGYKNALSDVEFFNFEIYSKETSHIFLGMMIALKIIFKAKGYQFQNDGRSLT
jgi:hypothetical protein